MAVVKGFFKQSAKPLFASILAVFAFNVNSPEMKFFASTL